MSSNVSQLSMLSEPSQKPSSSSHQRQREFLVLKEVIRSGTSSVNLKYMLSQTQHISPPEKHLITRYHQLRLEATNPQEQYTYTPKVETAEDIHIKAYIAHELKRHEQARQNYVSAMKQQSLENHLTYFNMGILAESHNVLEADRHYDKCLDLKPDFKEASQRKVLISCLNNEIGPARVPVKLLMVSQKDLRAKKPSTNWLESYNIALFTYKKGNLEESLRLFQKLEPTKNKELLLRCCLNVARIHESLGDIPKALAKFKQADLCRPNPCLKSKIESLEKLKKGPILSRSSLLRDLLVPINSDRVYRCLSNFRKQLKQAKSPRNKRVSEPLSKKSTFHESRDKLNQKTDTDPDTMTMSQVFKPCLQNKPLQPSSFSPRDETLKPKKSSLKRRLNVSSCLSQDPSRTMTVSEIDHLSVRSSLMASSRRQEMRVSWSFQAQEKLKPYREPEVMFNKQPETKEPPKQNTKKLQTSEKKIQTKKLQTSQKKIQEKIENFDFYETNSCRSLDDYVLEMEEPLQCKQRKVSQYQPPRESSRRIRPTSNEMQRESICKLLTIHIADGQNIEQRHSVKQSTKTFTNDFDRGVQHYKKYRFKEAVMCMKLVLNCTQSTDEQKHDAAKYLALIYQTLDVPERAVVYLKKNIANTPDVELFFKIEGMYRKIGKIHKAIPILKKGLDRFPKQPELFEHLGWIYLERNQLSTALDYLQKARSLDGYSNSIKLKLFHAYLLKKATIPNCKQLLSELFSGQTAEIVSQYQKVLLASFLESSGSYDQVLKILQILYQGDQSNQNYLYMMGRLHFLHNNYQDAFRYLSAALEANPTKIHAMIDLAQLYRKLFNYPRAIELFKKCTEIQVKNPIGWKGLADCDYDLEKYLTALKFYKKCRDTQTNKDSLFPVLTRIGDCMEKLGYYDYALKYYKQSLKTHISQPGVFTKIGNIYKKMGKYQKALEHYNAADQFNEYSDMENEIGKIQCLIGDKEYKQCLVLLNMLKNNWGAKQEVNLELELNLAAAFCYYGLNQFGKAITHYRKALKLTKTDEIYFNIAVCYHKQGQLNEAATNYTEAIKLNPTNPRAYFNMGALQKQRGEFASATEFIKKAVQLKPEEEWATILADIYLEMGNYKESERVLQNLLSMGETATREKNFYQMVKVQVRQSKIDFASEMFEQLRSQFPESLQLATIRKEIDKENAAP